jgi:hypothetical protein
MNVPPTMESIDVAQPTGAPNVIVVGAGLGGYLSALSVLALICLALIGVNPAERPAPREPVAHPARQGGTP